MGRSRSRSRSRSRGRRYRSPSISDRSRSRSASPDGYRVHVADIGLDPSKRELEKHFERYGPLIEIWVARNPPCFAFVVYKYKDDADAAIREMDGKVLSNGRIRCSFARPRTRNRRRKGFDPNLRCYQCGERGHFSRDCDEIWRQRQRNRERSYRKYQSPELVKKYSGGPFSSSTYRSSRRSRSRSRSRSRDKRRRSRESRSRSRSRSRQRRRSQRSSSKSPRRGREPKEISKSASPDREPELKKRSGSTRRSESEKRERSVSPNRDENHEDD